MPANWETFKSGFASYLDGKTAQSEADTAKQLALYYVNSVATAGVIGSGALINPLQTGLIENGFATSFNIAKTLQRGKTSVGTWNTAASAIIAALSTTNIAATPPIAPTIAPTTGYVITNPGSVSQLASGINSAFSIGNTQACVNLLAITFQTHLATVSGLYNGLIPSPSGPIPAPPISWVGIV
jgi:hypothetical protein